jgi:hypothetical protein
MAAIDRLIRLESKSPWQQENRGRVEEQHHHKNEPSQQPSWDWLSKVARYFIGPRSASTVRRSPSTAVSHRLQTLNVAGLFGIADPAIRAISRCSLLSLIVSLSGSRILRAYPSRSLTLPAQADDKLKGNPDLVETLRHGVQIMPPGRHEHG